MLKERRLFKVSEVKLSSYFNIITYMYMLDIDTVIKVFM